MDNRDPEIELLAHVYNALEVLDQMGRKRALSYLSDRLLADERRIGPAGMQFPPPQRLP